MAGDIVGEAKAVVVVAWSVATTDGGERSATRLLMRVVVAGAPRSLVDDGDGWQQQQ